MRQITLVLMMMVLSAAALAQSPADTDTPLKRAQWLDQVRILSQQGTK